MKKITSILLFAFLLTGCYNEAISESKEGNFKIEYLFEKDSVKVYRFEDGGRTHYFTTRGETMTYQQHGKAWFSEEIR